MLEFVDHRVWQKLLEDFGPHIDRKLHERHRFEGIWSYLLKQKLVAAKCYDQLIMQV